MMASHLMRAVLCGLAICHLGLADDSPSADGFRSELWKMEYREEEKPESESPQKQDENAKEASNGQNIAATITDTVPEHDRDYETTPGQIDLGKLQSQTPFAEWQVDTAAVAPNVNQRFRKMPTAWQLSQSGTMPMKKASKGPSMVTFFAAIVACVVVTGALFSGRE